MGTFYLILTPWTRLHLHQILHMSSLLKIERDEELKTVAASERQLQAEKKKPLNDHRRDLGPEPTPPSGPQHPNPAVVGSATPLWPRSWSEVMIQQLQ